MTASEPTTAEILVETQKILDELQASYQADLQAKQDAGEVPRPKEWFQQRLAQVKTARLENAFREDWLGPR